jgi:hypothetical protein
MARAINNLKTLKALTMLMQSQKATTYEESKTKLETLRKLKELTDDAMQVKYIEQDYTYFLQSEEGIAFKKSEQEKKLAKVLALAETVKQSYLAKGATEQEAEERKQLYIQRNK